MSFVYGFYSAPASAQRAYDDLQRAGLPPASIVVMSQEPFEEWPFMQQHGRSAMSWMAVAGAAAGLLTGYLLTSQTQQAWPINTGGMPIVSNWTNMVIMFELTMLGAVLMTVATLLRSARLPAKLPAHYDPDIAEGRIVIGAATDNRVQLDVLERTLRIAGADLVRRTE